MPPNTAATKAFRPGIAPMVGVTVGYLEKNNREPTPAKKEPMTKVMLMTPLMLMPISWAVSKSLDTARIAIPILVYRIRATRPMTRARVRTGVRRVTREVATPAKFTLSPIQGMVGYFWGRPPV